MKAVSTITVKIASLEIEAFNTHPARYLINPVAVGCVERRFDVSETPEADT
jgi:hypothetical protein